MPDKLPAPNISQPPRLDERAPKVRSKDQGWNEFLSKSKSGNTFRSYQSDIKHFEKWGGLLPASVGVVGEYLKHYADELSVSTLNRRVAALSCWHKTYRFVDPTTDPLIKNTMASIRRQYNRPPKKARPITYDELKQVIEHLESKIATAGDEGLITADQERQWLIAHRDRAMILMGFWRGFRAETLCHLKIENISKTNIRLAPGQKVPGLEIFLSASKGDRQARGETFYLPELPELCPVKAYNDWLDCAGLTKKKGVVFRKFKVRGEMLDKAMAESGAATWFKRLCQGAGIDGASEFSSHSLRRGLANLMVDRGADARDLMDHVGWKSIETAMGYVDKGQRGTAILLSKTASV